jgi:lambda family phage portal protein
MMAIADSLMQSGRGGYNGARLDRRVTGGWFASQSDADAAQLPDIPMLRDRCRDMMRNHPLAISAIGTTCQAVVGKGLSLQARPNARTLGWNPEQVAQWKENTESEWRLFAESANCDITRTQNFYGLQALVFRSALESGDCFALLPMQAVPGWPYKTRIQVIEADRIANPARGMRDGSKLSTGFSVWAGVEKDDYGAPVAYHILRQHPGSVQGFGKWQADRYAAFGEKTGRRNVLHLYDRLRPDQTRGVPFLAPVIESLHQLGKYTEAELTAAVVSGLFTVFVETPTGEGLNLTASAAAAQAGIVPSAGASTSANDPNKPLQMGAGLIVDLADGDKVQFADPKRPNTAFDGFVQSILRQIGGALGLPYEILVKQFVASYSAARAALLEAWRFYNGRRTWLADFFCQPIYEAWLDEAVASGRIPAPGYFANPVVRQAYLGTEWIGDAPGSIDPEKEVRAANARIELGVSSRQRETMELTGQNWEDVHAQQVREKQMRLRDGLETEGTPGAPGASAPAGAPDEKQNAEPDGDDTETGDREDLAPGKGQ